MKKPLLLLFILVATNVVSAQNLQLHRDFRHTLDKNFGDDDYFTSTLELFKADKWGSTFAFVDMDYNQSKGNIGLAYWEIARDIKMGKCPLMAHIEYNGGIGDGFSIPNSYLIGASYNFMMQKTFINTYLTYKYNAFEKASNDIQWTASWNGSMLDKKLTFCGFVDIWTENKDRIEAEGGKKIIFLAEPQFWYNVNSNVAVGTEIEVSNRFYPYNEDKLHVFPTLAAKWIF